MREVKRVTQLMLELYHLDALSKKERKFVENALLSDNNVYLRYHELKNIDKELKDKYLFNKSPVFRVIRNKDEIINNNNFKYKKILVGVIIAAGILCICIPVFMYFSNNINTNIIADENEQNYENEQIVVIEDNNLYIDHERIAINPSELEDTDIKKEDKKPSNEPNRIVNKPNIPKETEVENENKPLIENEVVTVVTAPDPQPTVYTRGSSNITGQNTAPIQSSTPDNSNLNIPPGISSIFDNMFVNKQYTEIIIPQRITSIGKNAFADNPIVSVTIGSNVSIDASAIPGSFANAYNNYGKAAGTYTRPDINSNTWSKK